MKVLTIANRKGGAGKSTCAAHLAVEASRAGYKTILIDLDPQKTLENWWGKREEEEPYLTDSSSSDLETKISDLKTKGFDVCIIDTPGDASVTSVNAIKVGDLVLVPSKATAPDLSAIGRTIAMLKENHKKFIFLVTQGIAASKNPLKAISILSEFGPVAPSPMTNRTSFANAMGMGGVASDNDVKASQEMSLIWGFVEEKLFGKRKGSPNGKTKV